MQRYRSPDGTPFGNEEIFRHGSRANAEHCGAVEWMITSDSLARMTGEVKYARFNRDRFESMAAAVALKILS